MFPKPEQGRRWVIADIHGCKQTFEYLVRHKIQLQTQDQLFLLGDYVDRGPDSGGVIDLILDLQNADYQVFPLRGNHEQMLLDSYQEYNPNFFLRYLKFEKCFNVANEVGEIYPQYLHFLNNLPFFYELEDFYLVHAGFNFSKPEPFNDFHGIVWLPKFTPPVDFAKRIVHGHSVRDLLEIENAVAEQKPIIPLDNGCVYRFRGRRKNKEVFPLIGNILALNLDTWELIVQENIETPPDISTNEDSTQN
ncbi:MAG: serine/threonine protein phosphatase [Microscillaceae bacterium]|nr:serine/threonine protein phosphatase [Microscillaceae bacterium]